MRLSELGQAFEMEIDLGRILGSKVAPPPA